MVRTFTLACLFAFASVASAGDAPKVEEKAPQAADAAQTKAATPSAVAASAPASAPAAKVGAPAPDFTLTDTEGKQHHLASYSDKVVVLEWFNPDCPFVKKHHEKNKTMATTSASYKGKEVVWLAINSGSAGKQGAGLERNQKAKTDYGITYPVLIDEVGSVGRAYGAKTTPHMFVIDSGTLVYAGAIDDNASPGTLGETNYVAKAVDAVLADKPVEMAETKSYGCSVKYGVTVP